MPDQPLTLPVAMPTRREQLVVSLQALFGEISGVEDLAPSVSLMELGFDSLLLSQASQALEKKFGVKIAFRQMLQEFSTIDSLADFLARSPAPSSRPSSSAPTTSPSAPAKAAPRRPAESSRPIEVPLSESQKELWLTAQAGDDASRAFNQVFALHLPGRLDEAALAAIVQQLIDRHDALRTTFAPDGATQIILPSLQLEIPFRDLSFLKPAQQEQALSDAAQHEAQYVFDLAKGPLLRARLFKLSGGRFTLLLSAHHIILDGWSIGVLMREFSQLYQAAEQGTEPGLDPAMQNQEFVEWYNSPAHLAIVEKSEAYWLNQSSPLPHDIEIPADRPRPAIQTFRARQKQLVLDAPLYESLKNSASAHGCTLFTYLLAGVNAWLYRLSGHEDMVIGIPSAGQLTVTGNPGNRLLVGHCVSMLPLRSRCAGEQSFADLLQAVKYSLLDAYEHQSLTIGSLVRKLQMPRDPSRAPLIPLVFNLGRSSRYLQLPDAHFSILPKQYTYYDLNLEVADSGNDLRVDCRYNTDLFDDVRIDRMLSHLETLLAAAASDTSRKLGDLPLLNEAERRHLLVDFNSTKVDYPKDRLIHQLIEDQAAATPDAVALAFEDETLTYGELNGRANQLARHLQKLGVGRDQLVGICMERSIEMVVGLLGIVKAGGAYVPIDPEYPKQRLTFMLEDSNVSLLLTQARLAETLPANTARLICLDTEWAAIARESDAPVENSVNADNLAYMIYTSGSTGRPKGAMNTHKGILNRLQWMQEAYQLKPDDRVLQKTPFSFDVSVWEFFWPLMYGARLVVARPGGHRDPAYLSQLIAREKITTLHFVPSMLQLFLAQEGLDKSCDSLKRVICSGEALPLELQRRFFAVLNAELHNLYGPTEAAVDVTYWACQRHTSLNTVPIGRPIANTQIYILDPKLRPVPIGLPGELHIGGVGLARGYHNRPELTAEKFIPDPFSSDPKARLYKTGDLARFLPDGNVEYLGRLDHQIKIRGLRIELGEIEEALNQYPGIETNVVVAREDTPGDMRLVAYTVNRDKTITTSQLRDYLHGRLPDYMVPAAFVRLDVMPLSPNGKVDRKMLPKPDFESGADKEKYSPPITPSQIAIEKIWSDVLGLKQAGIDDNFFALGGHSMLAVRILGRLKKQLDFNVPIPAFFQNPTIRKLAAVYDHERGNASPALSSDDSSRPDLIAYQNKGTRTPFFYLHGDWGGDGLYCGYLAQALDDDQPFYVLPPYRFGKTKVFPLEEMVDHHLAVLRRHTPHGPYLLGGFCAGATVAVEMARRLLASGEKVEHLILVDPPRAEATLLTPLWHLFDFIGNVLRWDLRKKIFNYDKYGVSISRWYHSSFRGKFEGIGRRLGLTKAGADEALVRYGEEGEPNVLESLDYGLYVLATCLHNMDRIAVPATVYFPEETPYTSLREKQPRQLFSPAQIELIPGTHLTCISRYPEVLAEKIQQALKKLNETNSH